MGLPLRYSKTEYSWCLDWKQMNKHYRTGHVSREWTKEEMIAYLDWDHSERERVEAEVEQEFQQYGTVNRMRGTAHLWGAS
jgi:hypothetical protein